MTYLYLSAGALPASVASNGGRGAPMDRPHTDLPNGASEKVGGVASACSALVMRRELDAFAATNSDDRPERRSSSSRTTAPLALAFALVLAGAFSVGAETWSAGRGASSVELRDTQAPGAVAEIVFHNSTGDGGRRATHSWALTHEGLTVQGEVDLGLGDPDTIRVRVPDGFIAMPDVETIPDGASAVVIIYPLHAVGM